MDQEAENIIAQVKDKITATLNLFQMNRQTGTTTSLQKAIADSNSPLFLSGEKRHGKHVVKETCVKYDTNFKDPRKKTISWNDISMPKIAGAVDRQLITDNFFMLRMLDSVLSAFDFMWAEIKRLKKQNSDLREANQNMKNKLNSAINETKELKENQKKIKKKMNKLKEKIDSYRNGRE